MLVRTEAFIGGAAGVGGGSPGPSEFTPADLLDLAVWIDGGLSSVSYHSSTLMSQAEDLSGNGNHMVQSTSGVAPNHGTRTINGIDVFDFDGSQWARIAAEIGDGGVVHLFAVLAIDENISGRYLFEAGALSDGADGWNVRQSTSSRVQVMVEDETETGRDIRVSNATFATGVPFLLEAKIDTNSLLSIAINGVASATTPTNGGMANPDNVLDIFTNSGGSNMTKGALAALIICTSIQDANKTAQTVAYLRNRWGL